MVLFGLLTKVVPIALLGLVAILFFKKAFTTSTSEAGADVGSGIASLGSSLGSVGSGIGSLGSGIGAGLAGLFKPIWELKNLAEGWGLGSTSTQTETSSQQRVSTNSRRRTTPASTPRATPTTSSVYTSTQQGSYANKSGGVSYY